MITPLTFNTPLRVHSTSQCIITTQWHKRIITRRVHTLIHKGETLSKVPRRNSHSPGCGERGWGLTQEYTQNIQSRHMARWGHSVLGALLRWCPYLRGDVLITVLLHQVKTLKGVSSRGLFYTLVRSELWSHLATVKKLLWAEVPHLLGTLSVDQGVAPVLLPWPRFAWLGSLYPSVYMMVSTWLRCIHDSFQGGAWK